MIPFEVVSVVLLAALIGGIVLARRDPETGEELPMPAAGTAASSSLGAAQTANVTAEGGDA